MQQALPLQKDDQTQAFCHIEKVSFALSEKIKEECKRRIPEGCFGTPRDVAEAVAFFASNEAKYITGQVLCVDGGMTFA